MNTSPKTRLASFAFASLLTLAMLLGINGLATSDTASQMAQQQAPLAGNATV